MKALSKRSLFKHQAYISEPITRCPPREKGRIQTLVHKLAQALESEPYLTQLYIPSLVTAPEVRARMEPRHVYFLDRIRIVEADFLLVVADHASFGIGGEVEIATALGKPVIFFSRAKKVSRFLLGTPANVLASRQPSFLLYREWRDLKPQLLPLIEDILLKVSVSRQHGFPFFQVGRHIKKFREQRQLSLQQLARQTGVETAFLELLEADPAQIRKELAVYEDVGSVPLGRLDLSFEQWEQFFNLGLPLLSRIAAGLDLAVNDLLTESSQGERLSAAAGKGPLRELAQRTKKSRLRCVQNLEFLATQYDVTYREFRRLFTTLVEDVYDQNPGNVSGLQSQNLSKLEFLDALSALRQDTHT